MKMYYSAAVLLPVCLSHWKWWVKLSALHYGIQYLTQYDLYTPHLSKHTIIYSDTDACRNLPTVLSICTILC